MGVTSNTFCAGGMSTANGSWVVYGYVHLSSSKLAKGSKMDIADEQW